MAQVDLPYLWAAIGRNGTYWYYRRGGQLIPIASPEGQRLKCGDVGFMEAYERIHASFGVERRPAPHIGTIAHGIDEYRADAEFQQLKPRTKRRYNQDLGWLKENHGHRQFADLPREAVLKMRKERVATPAAANGLVSRLSILLNYVEDRPQTFRLPKGWQNPMRRRVKPLKQGDGHWPWEEDEIEEFRKRWSRDVARWC